MTLSERMKWGQNEADRLCEKGAGLRPGREAAALGTLDWMPSVAKQQQLSGRIHQFFRRHLLLPTSSCDERSSLLP